jgi:hypothetical protein
MKATIKYRGFLLILTYQFTTINLPNNKSGLGVVNV